VVPQQKASSNEEAFLFCTYNLKDCGTAKSTLSFRREKQKLPVDYKFR